MLGGVEEASQQGGLGAGTESSNTGLETVSGGQGTSSSTPGSSPSSGTIPSLIGLSPEYMSTGIGAGFLGTLLGADTFSKINIDISGHGGFDNGQALAGAENPTFQGLLKYGAYLGAALTSLLVLFHGVLMFFNKMEYGDVLGEARDRFIGIVRAALAFGLVMPIASGGLATAQYAVGYAAVASNGIGNKAAETVLQNGFGSPSSPLNVFSVEHDAAPEQSAKVFADMVGQHSCLSYMKSINATPKETREMCATSKVGAGGEFDVGYDEGGVEASGDAEFCSDGNGGWFGGGGDGSTAFMRNACVGMRDAQRTAYNEIKDLYEKYDNNIESPEAMAEMTEIAEKMQKSIANNVTDINSAIADDQGMGVSGEEFDGGTYMAHEMTGFIKEAGWPGLGLIYSTIGSQIDAVTGLQSTNGTPSAGFSLDRLKEAGRQANSAVRIAQSDSARGAAAANASTGVSGADTSTDSSWLGSLFGAFGDGVNSAAEWLNVGGQNLMMLLFNPVFNDPGPVATHKIGSTILGGVMVVAAVDFVSGFIPAGKVVGVGAKFGKKVKGALSKFSGKKKDGGFFDGGSILKNLFVMYLSILLMLTLLVASFLVLILPKIPIFLVSFLALEWAIWCAIVIFGAPLWVALNMTVIGNQPGLFTQRALSGLGVLLYIILFPTMVVAAVVISVLAYNLIIPILSMMLLMAFGGGIVEMVLGIFAMPLVMLIALMVGAFVSITAISRIPSMITNYLGVSAPGGSVSESINTFIASPTSFSNLNNPQQMLTKGGAAMTGKK